MRGQRTPSLPLRWRMIALLTVLAGLLVVDAALVAAYTRDLAAEQARVSALRPVEEVPERLVSGLVDQQNSVRGFALTGHPSLLEAYQETQRVEGRALSTLHRRLGSQPELLALVRDFGRAATVWHRRVAEPAIRAARAGRTDEAAALVRSLDEPLFDQMRDDAAALAEALDTQLALGQSRAVAAGDRLQRQLLASSALGLLLLLLSALLIRSWLTSPVTWLSAQLRRVAAGRLHEQIVGTGPAEFVQLGHDADVMRRRILDELEESRRATEALQQNAPLVAGLRDQLVTDDVTPPPGLRLACRFEPAEGVLAGDWVQELRLDDDRIAVVVVDVSGHGPDAGLRALRLKHLLVPALTLELEPADALHWVTGQIGDTGEWFATCVVLEVEASTGRCLYANAGHPPALLVTGSVVQQILPTGPLLSDLPGSRWDTARFTLAEGDLLALYTDGITEARTRSGEMFGEQRLAACLASSSHGDLALVAEEAMARVHAFAGDRLDDDSTLVLVARGAVSDLDQSTPPGASQTVPPMPPRASA